MNEQILDDIDDIDFPVKSSMTVRKGAWYIYRDDENETTFHLWCSSWNGKQKLFADRKLILERRNLSFNNPVQIKYNDSTYKIESTIAEFGQGNTLTTFYKDNKIQKEYITKSGKKILLSFVLIIVLATGLGSVKVLLERESISNTLTNAGLLVALSIGVLYLIKYNLKFSIEEVKRTVQK